ncbi:hypothetical protein LCGC14_1795080 [marine sediment metagenome]|uniref:Uncharacterized protein n=1 Tax=marine sediment metagenome TaxID=412755 RepID=A0A0F9J663_9ZZZZ
MERTEENKSTVQRQVGRFQAMNYGCNDDRHTELADVFLGFANPEDVSRAVTHFIRTEDQCPTVAQVLNHKLEMDRQARWTLKRADPNCVTCSGTGWQQTTRTQRGWPLGDVVDYDCVETCHCRRKAAA